MNRCRASPCANSLGKSLMATKRPMSGSCARATRPWAPEPMISRISYRPTCIPSLPSEEVLPSRDSRVRKSDEGRNEARVMFFRGTSVLGKNASTGPNLFIRIIAKQFQKLGHPLFARRRPSAHRNVYNLDSESGSGAELPREFVVVFASQVKPWL